ncbi:MAG: YesL family protein [Lachnospiraceae bacterium]|nr:YesL family protein [Lachnospiraceae bacterium]
MGKLFDLESPLFSGLNKLADLVYLNILTMICCIPVVTIGASMTALNYVVLKMVRNEEGYITRAFFKSFRQNFKQATVIWLILLLIAGVLAGDVFIFNYSTLAFPTWIRIMLVVVAFIMVFSMMHVFPVLARFDNSIKHTFKNSLFMGILSLPKTILMMVCWAVPVVILTFFFQAFPIVFVLGISGPAFVCALLYNKTFKRFEPEENADQNEWSSTLEEEIEHADETMGLSAENHTNKNPSE